MSRRLIARSVDILNSSRFYVFLMNISDKNLTGSLMKTKDLWYKTLQGLRPAAVAPPGEYARTLAESRSHFCLGINGITESC